MNYIIYTVLPGDTLWDIAGRYCGNPNNWKNIILDNPNIRDEQIFVGQQIRLKVDRQAASLGWSLYQNSLPSIDHPAHQKSLLQARVYIFVIGEELNSFGEYLVRKVIVNDRMSQAFFSKTGIRLPVLPDPEKFGILTDQTALTSLGEHATNLKPSPYTSTSSNLLGTPRFIGKRYWIDVNKATKAGATIHSTAEILDDLNRLSTIVSNPEIIENAKRNVLVDHEFMIKGNIPRTAIKGFPAMATLQGLRVIRIVGLVITPYDIGKAIGRSIEQASFKPIGAEATRQTGGWGGAFVGARVGAAVGALLGIETGPGALFTAAAGSIIFGAAGYFGSDWVADMADEN